ncbi:hypothetical protein Ddye_028586 [Dipteronia dyeriana]|uniref:Uncharacterized protein n=1 Tax=Dipteronia dyeriana TaxID=168575 RepID=A0AAD9WJU2_9ROSI|nr:hypothetical protein Ddye_028586 [Dipteronia dyeriana]
MSWIRNAMNKAVEVGNKNNLTRTVKNYADTVVQQAGQAVVEGAKILQDRIGVRNFKSVKQTIRRLEEAAVSCRVPERVTLLRRWLVVLKEVEKLFAPVSEDKEKVDEQQHASDESKGSPKRPSMVLYYDSDVGGEPLNFRDVFLQSQALEGITLSMILEAPNDEEISLLLEMFGLCLTGGKEVHNAITSSIQDLATAIARYQDEVLVKREELLQFAQTAITGLKINADIVRIDAEVSDLKKKLEGMNAMPKPIDEGLEQTSEKTTKATIEALKKALAHIRVCSRLEGLLLKKRLLNNGDSPEIHAQKVDKLKVLSESLMNSSAKAEKRISDHRLQKEEALKVRVVKAGEASEKEKEIGAEISYLEKQRDHLEAELKKVNISLAAAQSRLRNAQEERDHFDEANSQIVEHLNTKEDELLKSITACGVEAEVLHTWINFLEDTWVLQCLYTEVKDKQVNDELEKHGEYFVNLAVTLLSAYDKELTPSITLIEKFVENLKNLKERSEMVSGGDNEDPKELNLRRSLEEEYLEFEAKIITTFSVVDIMKEQFYAQRGTNSRKDDTRVKELFDDIEKLRQEFESIERPNLELEARIPRSDAPSNEKSLGSPANPPIEETPALKPEKIEHPEAGAVKAEGTPALKPEKIKHPEARVVKEEPVLDPDSDLAQLESEFGKVGNDYATEEIGDWEFDELEKELKSDSTSK